MDRTPKESSTAPAGEGWPVKSRNFEFVRSRQPALSVHAAFAEAYVHTDPIGCVGRLRMFAEELVRDVYARGRLPQPYQANLNDLLQQTVFTSSVPEVVQTKLHMLRKKGNHAAHGGALHPEVAIRLLKEAFDLASWFFVAVLKQPRAGIPPYSVPPAPVHTKLGVSKKQLQREKKKLLQELESQKSRMAEVVAAAEERRAELSKLADRLELTEAELEAARSAGEAAASGLGLSEAHTRREFVDLELLDAGWDIKDKRQVGLEVEVRHQPTSSGKGAADYVLWGADGKPLAVIEAKKTARSAQEGRTQARIYADGLEKDFGQRPVIFYTNGYETWIWDDKQNDEPPRRVFGFYAKDSLEQLHFQRRNRTWASDTEPNLEIAGRVYQLEAIKRVCERFDGNHRKALLVQATGTGKTRVAVAITDVLLRSNSIKRALFLCDRRELRKQARNAFREFLPDSNPTIVTRKNVRDVGPQVYISTYQTMMEHFEHFDVGFFDLIIADESHRSVYNFYGDLFRYFDALQLGLTATPVHFIDRNTYDLFGCEDQDPTANYDLEDAVADKYLVPMRVVEFQTEFQRKGMRYADMTAEQQRELEEQVAAAQTVDYDSDALDRAVFNKDTNRLVIRNLMDNGIHIEDGAQLGKTILFARNHDHAQLLKELFDEMYPAYGGGFCEVIDYKNSRAEQLIDDFKGEGHRNDVVIAISVDMLDTGVDIPDVVNLVFAKPIRSYVKFWQMIGRGTRLCENLFGPGKHKKEFFIFDHWGNFQFFGLNYQPPPAVVERSIQQRVFEARIALAAACSHKLATADFERTMDLIRGDLKSLSNTRSIAVREKRKLIDQLSDRETLHDFSAVTQERLRQEIPRLMKWRNIRGHEAAWRFDELMTNLQAAHVQELGDFADLKGAVRNWVNSLRMNLGQVKAKSEAIQKVRDDDFWEHATTSDLEWLRTELRDVAGFRRTPGPGPRPHGDRRLDVHERGEESVRSERKVKNYGLDLVAYRQRVTDALNHLMDESSTLQKIQRAEPVDETDLDELCGLVLEQNPNLDLKRLSELYPETAGRLASAIRRVIGVDAAIVTTTFDAFIHEHPHLTANQMSFLRLLKKYIVENGGIERTKPYAQPFTRLHSEGLDGVFPEDDEADAIMTLLDRFFVDRPSQPPPPPTH